MLEWEPFISTGGDRRTYWRTALFSFVMLAAALASNAVMDTLQFHFKGSVFDAEGLNEQWWNPALSWSNKWKDGVPEQGERFPLSSTALTGVTDAWHFFKSLTVFFIGLAIVAPFTRLFYLPWYGWVAGSCAVLAIFWAGFEVLLRVL